MILQFKQKSQIIRFSNEVHIRTGYSRRALKLEPWTMSASTEKTKRNSDEKSEASGTRERKEGQVPKRWIMSKQPLIL